MDCKIFERLVATRRLPSPSATALKVLEIANKEDASIVELTEVIAADPAIAARVLKYANSPLVAPRTDITTIQRAVMMLGIRAVKVTALSFSLVKREDFSRCPHFGFDVFWAHSAATATAARAIAAATASALRDEAFVAGLLSRTGKLAFAMAIPEEYEPVLAKTGHVMRDGIVEERLAFDTDNIEVGAELLSRWKVPTLLVEAVRHQTNPDSAATADGRALASAIQHGRQIADILCGLVIREGASAVEELGRLSMNQVEKQFHDLAGILEISLKDLPEPEDIESRAQWLLEEMSVATQVENKCTQARNQELQQLSRLDSLTGLANRKAFDDQLAAELERARRYGRPMSLLMADIDRFKWVNDTYGHIVGDAVLKVVASKFKQSFRRCDFAARYGGEEFAVIAGETDLESALQLAERLRCSIQDVSIPVPTGAVKVTISIGVASLVNPHAELEPTKLISAADLKLYEAKQGGRNRCCHGAAK